MSTTSITLLQEPHTASVNSATTSTCRNCGIDLADEHGKGAQDTQQRIEELEAQIKILTIRATEAVERATDYEDALRQFASAMPSPNLPAQIITTAGPASRPATASSDHPAFTVTAGTPHSPSIPSQPPNSRLSRLLPTRRSNVPSLSTAPLQPQQPVSARYPYPYPHTAGLPSTDTETELLSALTREQTLRLAAESRETKTNEEIEELTGQLFQQANEMVATERKARARLEERVLVLEKRDGEKAKRLEVLENRLGRIERVRGLLKDREKERGRERSGERAETEKDGA